MHLIRYLKEDAVCASMELSLHRWLTANKPELFDSSCVLWPVVDHEGDQVCRIAAAHVRIYSGLRLHKLAVLFCTFYCLFFIPPINFTPSKLQVSPPSLNTLDSTRLFSSIRFSASTFGSHLPKLN